jgi:hypothetical protein
MHGHGYRVHLPHLPWCEGLALRGGTANGTKLSLAWFVFVILNHWMPIADCHVISPGIEPSHQVGFIRAA